MMGGKIFYQQDFLEKQLNYYKHLPEKQRRHFLAMEYERLGKGSQRYLSRIFKCDRRTITKGLLELTMLDTEIDYTRQRSVGGGRKKKNSQLNN
jgi:hypothetical protein